MSNSITGFSLQNALALIECFGGYETDMTIEFLENGHSGPGYYAWCTDYQEDGAEFLGPASDHSHLSILHLPAPQQEG